MHPLLIQALLAATAGFSLEAPEATFELPQALKEVSGLAASSKGTLWAVGDERGTLFELSPNNGKVIRTVEFERKGDFESVEEVPDGTVIAGRSDGTLFLVDPKDPKQATKLEVKVGPICDLEGIAWLAAKKRLLLSCKNEAISHSGFAIYALDLQTKKLDPEPWAVVKMKALKDYVAAHPDDRDLKHVKLKSFGPSGLAVHPKTGEVWVLSSTGRMLLVLGTDGGVRRIEGLDRKTHAHPEGLCFTSDGTLFIGNEGNSGKAVVQRFTGGAAGAEPTGMR